MRQRLGLANSSVPAVTVCREGCDVEIMWHWGKINIAPDEARELARLLNEAADHNHHESAK